MISINDFGTLSRVEDKPTHRFRYVDDHIASCHFFSCQLLQEIGTLIPITRIDEIVEAPMLVNVFFCNIISNKVFQTVQIQPCGFGKGKNLLVAFSLLIVVNGFILAQSQVATPYVVQNALSSALVALRE